MGAAVKRLPVCTGRDEVGEGERMLFLLECLPHNLIGILLKEIK